MLAKKKDEDKVTISFRTTRSKRRDFQVKLAKEYRKQEDFLEAVVQKYIVGTLKI